MIYLDNAATTFPKPKSVIKEIEKCITNYCANAGRSSHTLATKTGEEIYNTRECIADFLSFDRPENICFTTNATYALNFAIKSLIIEKCHVLISDLEHNSVLRPVNKLTKEVGIEYSIFETKGDIYENIKRLIRPNTKAIISTLTSNVSGKEIPISLLSKISKEYSLIFIADASQCIGHKKIDLSTTPCDALCAPGHKGLFGIQGVGFIVFDKNRPQKTLIEGGSGNESKKLNMPNYLPEKMEAGTLPTPAIVALKAGIKYISSIGLNEVSDKLNELTNYLKQRLENINSIELFGAENGIISFKIKNKNANECASILDEYGICTRAGLHCAPLAHKTLGTEDFGLIRVSLSIFNKKSDIDFLLKTINNVFV